MAEGFFVAGLAGNPFLTAETPTLVSLTEDPLFPISNLQNADPWKPFRFKLSTALLPGSTTSGRINVDMNQSRNGGFELDPNGTSPPSFWNLGNGTPEVSTDAVGQVGAKSLKLDAANEWAYKDFSVPPASTQRLTFQLRGDGTHAVNAVVTNLATGNTLQSGLTWANGGVYATRTTATFAQTINTFTVESAPLGHVGPVTLRVSFHRPATITAAAYVDEVYMWPRPTVCAFIGHELPSSWYITCVCDDDPAFPSQTTAGTTFPSQNRFRNYFALANSPATPERYWRIEIFVAAPLLNPLIGTIVLAERKVFVRNPNRNITISRVMPVGGNEDRPVSLAAAPRYRAELAWRNTTAGLSEAIQQMIAASRYGEEPILIVPRDDRDTFVYGRGSGLSEISHREVAEGVYEYALSITDDPYPTMVT